MGFQDLDWPSDSQLFPTHETVLKYIDDYSADVQDLVRYCTQVIDVSPIDPKVASSPWKVTTRNLLTSEDTSEAYDAVIVANGHFIVPYIPPFEVLPQTGRLHRKEDNSRGKLSVWRRRQCSDCRVLSKAALVVHKIAVHVQRDPRNSGRRPEETRSSAH
jgi:hypothetical protein